MAKTVRVHDDTHRVLMNLKASRRSGSLDQVIREMIRESTGRPVEKNPTPQTARSLRDFIGP